MKAHGDFESVNFGTGELARRVAGNGESRLESRGWTYSRHAGFRRFGEGLPSQSELDEAYEKLAKAVKEKLDALPQRT